MRKYGSKKDVNLGCIAHHLLLLTLGRPNFFFSVMHQDEESRGLLDHLDCEHTRIIV